MFKALVVSLCAVVPIMLTGCLSQQAEPTKQQVDQVEKEIRQLENDIFAAIQQKNTKKLEAILADDFVYRNPLAGEISRAAFLDEVRDIPVNIIAVWSEDIKANVYGDVAVLTGTQKAKTQNDRGKEEVSATAFIDIFVRRTGRWQLALAHGVYLPAKPSSQ